MTNEEMFNAIVEACDNLGLSYTDYSGRCMYGKKCIGVISHNYDNDLFYLGKEIGGNYPDFDTDIRIDNLGLSTIIYFPYISWFWENEDEDES